MGLEGRDLLRFFGIWGLGFKGKTFWAHSGGVSGSFRLFGIHSGGFRDLLGFFGIWG